MAIPDGLVAGAVISNLTFTIAIGLPLVVAVALVESLHVPDANVPMYFLAAAGVATITAGAIGVAFGGRPELTRAFALGALVVPAFMGVRMLALMSSLQGSVALMLWTYVVAGFALPLGFLIGKHRRPGRE